MIAFIIAMMTRLSPVLKWSGRYSTSHPLPVFFQVLGHQVLWDNFHNGLGHLNGAPLVSQISTPSR